MLDTGLVDNPLESPSELPASDSRLHQAAQLADSGDYLQSAQIAATLLQERVYDIRLVGFFLFGVFLERGLSSLPAILTRIHGLLTTDFAAIGPQQKKIRTVDTALGWLFRTMADRCHYHSVQQDATWNDWLTASPSDVARAAQQASQTLGPTVATVLGAEIDTPQCLEQLARLQRWLSDKLGPALARVHRESAADADADGTAGGDGAAGAAADRPAAPTATAPDAAGGVPGDAYPPAPAMQILQRKLHAFEVLMARQDFAKAAVVASDIREVVANFDPLVYLPRLFSTYFRLLSSSIDELVPYWDNAAAPSWEALTQFYRADLDAFLAD